MFKKILIYNSGGGLGDAIQLFPLILSLKNHFKNCTFFYVGAHQNHFNEKLKEFNINLETINLDLKFFGFSLAIGVLFILIYSQSRVGYLLLLMNIFALSVIYRRYFFSISYLR